MLMVCHGIGSGKKISRPEVCAGIDTQPSYCKTNAQFSN